MNEIIQMKIYSFCIKIDSKKSDEIILELLLSKLDLASKLGEFIVSSGNILLLDNNYLYEKNPEISEIIDDAWIYYKWNLIVFPDKEVTLANQIFLAKKIISILKDDGCQTRLLAEFEDDITFS